MKILKIKSLYKSRHILLLTIGIKDIDLLAESSFEDFDKYPERPGTEIDAERLYKLFRKLGFEDVRPYNDLSVRKVKEKLREAAEEEDPAEHSCLIVFILTHGEDGLLCARDGMYHVNSLYEIFNGNDCPKFRGKPKLFFIQACQGDKTDSGGLVICKESMDSSLKIPTYADFLIMHSTFPGFVSFKNSTKGSYFIQYLCNVLEEHGYNKHLMDMLTIVIRRFILYFESSNFKDESKDRKKQVPCITSTLSRNVKFSTIPS